MLIGNKFDYEIVLDFIISIGHSSQYGGIPYHRYFYQKSMYL